MPGLASLAVADLLEGPARPARVLGAFPAAVYLAVPSPPGVRVVALVGSTGVALPNAVVLPRWAPVGALANLRGAEGWVGAHELAVGGLRVAARRWWDPRPRLRKVSPAALAEALDVLTGRHPVGPDEGQLAVAPRIAELEAALRRDDPTACVQAAAGLVGLGPGLTPAGDDVLAGLLAALRLLGEALPGGDGRAAALADRLEADVVATAHRRTPALSAALLVHAARGEAARPAASLLHALTGRGDLLRAAAEVARIGHTSGRDLLTGIRLVGAAVPPAAQTGRHRP